MHPHSREFPIKKMLSKGVSPRVDKYNTVLNALEQSINITHTTYDVKYKILFVIFSFDINFTYQD